MKSRISKREKTDLEQVKELLKLVYKVADNKNISGCVISTEYLQKLCFVLEQTLGIMKNDLQH